MLYLTFLLLVISFLLVLVGMLIMMLSVVLRRPGSLEGSERRVEGGGIIVVGPIPIVFGTSERVTKALILLAIALLVTAVVSFIIISSGHWG